MPNVSMIRAYGWRGGCPAAGVKDAGVGSVEWLGILMRLRRIMSRIPQSSTKRKHGIRKLRINSESNLTTPSSLKNAAPPKPINITPHATRLKIDAVGPRRPRPHRISLSCGTKARTRESTPTKIRKVEAAKAHIECREFMIMPNVLMIRGDGWRATCTSRWRDRRRRRIR
jgi:hypothetical protein